MVQRIAVCVAVLAVAALSAGQAISADVQVKGPHICCKQCVKVVAGILGKVDGVSDAKCDITAKTISFTAKDDATAKAAFKALADGGFFGACTSGGKEVKLDVAAGSKDKAETVAIKDVHVCCNQCQTAIKSLFKDAKVSFTDPKGPQRTVRIEGAGLSSGGVLEALRKAGFNGTAEK